MAEHSQACCELCGRQVVICGKCGNNCCNGGAGTVDGAPCTECASAHKLDDELARTRRDELWLLLDESLNDGM